jgi:hypothetical protein
MARFCAEILATGSQCTQFARKGQPWCRAHADPRLRERNGDTRQFIAWVADQDLSGLANGLGKIACDCVLNSSRRSTPKLFSTLCSPASMC